MTSAIGMGTNGTGAEDEDRESPTPICALRGPSDRMVYNLETPYRWAEPRPEF